MKPFSKLSGRNWGFLALLAGVIVASSISAMAVPPAQTLLTFTNQTLTGKCCFVWGDTVKVTQPTAVTPVIVTWSVEYRTSDNFFVGLSVNNGQCIAHGARSIDPWFPSDGSATTRTFQWVVDASEMVKGANTFKVCGGGALNNDDNITIGLRTLTVQIGK